MISRLTLVLFMCCVLEGQAYVQVGTKKILLDLSCSTVKWALNWREECSLEVSVSDMGHAPFKFTNTTFLQHFPLLAASSHASCFKGANWLVPSTSIDSYRSETKILTHLTTSTTFSREYPRSIKCSKAEIRLDDGTLEEVGNDCLFKTQFSQSSSEKKELSHHKELTLALTKDSREDNFSYVELQSSDNVNIVHHPLLNSPQLTNVSSHVNRTLCDDFLT